ncbi:MAG: hypothetical protein H6767_08890 [Candidatus Peribacteria bacterium]|nr:MAG: hypothetical protein H6767_08890 [Candidatus Peribacteria bacterium]
MAILLPIFIFVTLVFINPDILGIYAVINIYWLTEVRIPLILSISVFFVAYIMLIWVSLKVEGYIIHRKEVKLETEVRDLKANLQDGQAGMIERLTGEFKDVVENHEKQTAASIQKLEKEHAKNLADLEKEVTALKKQVSKIK